MKNIVLCSGQPILIEGFRAAVQDSGEFFVSVCRDAALLPELVKEVGAHIVLADTNCGITLNLLSELRVIAPVTALVLWVDTIAPEFIYQAIDLGILGVLSKGTEIESCFECLRQVSLGRFWLQHELSNKLIRTNCVSLTMRQRQLVGMLTQGLKNKEIAYKMGVTEGTVKVYLSHIYKKTGANDRFGLALFALKNLESGQISAADREVSGPAAIPNFSPRFLSFDRNPGILN